MEYIGIQTQVRKNNLRTILILCSFPLVVAFLCGLFLLVFTTGYFQIINSEILIGTGQILLHILPYILGGCVIWFIIAYFFNAYMIKRATCSTTLCRKEYKRVYNLVENLCMSQGMEMPKVNIIEDDLSLNAFASGINKKTYAITLTRGIIDELDDDELEGVIAHELTHIINKDVRLVIVTIVFVGIFTFLSQLLISNLFRRGKKNIIVILVGLAVVGIGYLISSIMRFSISRKREYMADAGAAEMSKKPWALASALKKISNAKYASSVENKNVAPLFISNPFSKQSFAGLFSSHPPIEKRIEILEQF